jgi:hypothetical protein
MKTQWYVLLAIGLAVTDASHAGAQTAESITRSPVDEQQASVLMRPSGVSPASGPVDGVRRIPRTPREGAIRGAKNGAIVGAIVTLAVSAFALRGDLKGDCHECMAATPIALAFGAVATAGTTIAGAGIGAAAPGWHSRPPVQRRE